MRGWFADCRRNRRPARPTAGRIGHRTGGEGWEEPRARLGRILLGAALLLALGRLGVPAWAQTSMQDSMHDANEPGVPQTRETMPGQPSLRPGEVLPPPAGMSFTTHLDHTAIWVGDQFHYTIIVDYSPNYEFVLDTVSKDTINMEPFQVMNVSHTTVPLKDGSKRLFLDLTLTCFTTGKTSETIPQLTLFYFRRDRGVVRAEEAAAESLTVPGPEIGVRTTLPSDPIDIRDAISVSDWPRSRWWLAGVGAFSLLVLVVGLGWETATFLRRRKVQQGPDREKAMEIVRERWLSSVPGNFSDTEVRAQFYDQSYQNLKEYLGYYLDSPALGLTAEELQEEMQRLGTDRELTSKVADTLGALETARYAQNGTAPGAEAAQKMAQEIRGIFTLEPRR